MLVRKPRRPLDDLTASAQSRPHRRAHPFRKAHADAVEELRVGLLRNSGRDAGVPQARAIQVRLEAAFPRYIGGRLDLLQTPDLSASAVVRVLQAQQLH